MANQWKIVFFISAGIYVFGSIVYWFLGTAEPQPWGKFDEKIENISKEETDVEKEL